jgi:endonuclease/exonuclease/phosphatase family metal-dependent hydrolase
MSLLLLTLHRWKSGTWRLLPGYGPKLIKPELHKVPGNKSVKILTYNFYMRPPLIKSNESDHKELRLSQFEKHINDFDVIALQEMFALGSSRQDRFIAAARKYGFNYYCRSIAPPFFSLKFVDGGLLILSKYPIVEKDGHIFTQGNQIDYYAAKQVIYTKLLLNEKSDGDHDYLHLFTTHMQASYYENDDKLNAINDQARMSQAKEMVDFVQKKIENSPYPALLTGDFNINARRNRNNGVESSEEYVAMMDYIHSVFSGSHFGIDLVRKRYGFHPVTYGDVFVHPETEEVLPRERVITNPVDHGIQECLDYMILLDTQKNIDRRAVQVKDTKVEEFFNTDPDIAITQCSDHYGISSVLQINPS